MLSRCFFIGFASFAVLASSACGVKGDPIPYLEMVRRAEEARAAEAKVAPPAPVAPVKTTTKTEESRP